jgi:lon-related putative ATP-dependent protease
MSATSKVSSLPPDQLGRQCDPEQFDFETTDDLPDLTEIIGQPRASKAVEFGLGIRGKGFHIYALGPEATDKQSLVRHFVEARASEEAPPFDLCYVHNFVESHRPCALQLPPGTGRELADDMDHCLDELKVELEAAFESEEYQTRRQGVQEAAGEQHQESLDELAEQAKERGLALLRTPLGFVFAPVREGEVIPPEELEKLGEEDKEQLEEGIKGLQEQLQGILRQIPRQQREVRDQLRDLNSEVARFAAHDLLEELRKKYSEYPEVVAHLDAVEKDVVENVRQLLTPVADSEQEKPPAASGPGPESPAGHPSQRYRVNVLVDHTESGSAPIVYEENPTYQNLLGRIEYLSVMGTLVTDFTMIKPGALHRANGGYLILDARRVLLTPFAWEGLKRALQSRELRTESPGESLGLMTVSLDPEPMPLDLKVVLFGSRMLYYLLSQHDPDFQDLFKVAADFADEIDRSPESEALYARMIATLARQESLRPFDRTGVAAVVDRSARMVGDSEKLSVRTRGVVDLLREASYWAGEDGVDAVTGTHVARAVDEWTYRSDRMRELSQEQILRETVYIDTEGERIGQINGLSVLQLGGFAFGRPSRITARVRLGSGHVIDIEREVELGGPIHSKGVFILSGFLGGRYGSERPLSLSASLVFEQSYGGIDGDSASSAELYALLSAISGVPLAQSIAVTGSVNQHGQVQPIGGVNEKIEGFFDVCRARGLTGHQGVMIPASNVKHLMVRDDIREAVAAGQFNIWPVRSVDQGIEVLTGIPMGARDEDGQYPQGTINQRVEARLTELAEKRKEFAAGDGADRESAEDGS